MWAWLKAWGSPPEFYRRSGRWLPWIVLPAVLFLMVGLVWGLVFAPPDYQQGDSFRIIYVHVPSAFLAQSCYLMMALGGAIFLIWRIKMADVMMACAAPTGAALTLMALATGAIWGKPTWGTWWVWDARTTSMLILFFLYLGVIVLRQAGASSLATARACAILLLVGVVNIPIIKYSVDWWFTLHQGASFTLVSKPTMPASMYVPLIFSALGFHGLFAAALLLSMRVELLFRESRTAWARRVRTDERLS